MILFLTNVLRKNFFVLLLLFPSLLFSQENFSGILKDKNTGEPIVGALVQIDNTFNYSLSDAKGEFKISGVKEKVSFIGRTASM